MLLGEAHFRLGRNTDAFAALARSIARGGRFPVRQHALLAMTLQRLGRFEEATSALGDVQVLMQEPLNSIDRENQSIWAEAAAVVKSANGGEPLAGR